MWWAKSDAPAQAWVGERCFAWRGVNGAVSVQPIAGAQEAPALLRARMADEQPRSLRIWLSNAVCRLDRVPAIQGVRHGAEAQEAVAAMLRGRSALPNGARVLLPQWPYPQSHWCVAVADGALLDALQASAGPALRSIKPWWSWALAGLEPIDEGAAEGQPAGTGTSWALFDGDALITAQVDATGACTDAGTTLPVADTGTAQRIINRRRAGGDTAPLRCWQLAWPLGSATDTSAEVPPPAEAPGAPFGFTTYLRRGDAF